MCFFVSFLYRNGNLYFGEDMCNHHTIEVPPGAGTLYEGEWIENVTYPEIRLEDDVSDNYNNFAERIIMSKFPTRDSFILHGALQILRRYKIPQIWRWGGWGMKQRLLMLRRCIDHSERFGSRSIVENNARILFGYADVANPSWSDIERRFNTILHICRGNVGGTGDETRWQIAEMRYSLLKTGVYREEK